MKQVPFAAYSIVVSFLAYSSIPTIEAVCSCEMLVELTGLITVIYQQTELLIVNNVRTSTVASLVMNIEGPNLIELFGKDYVQIQTD
jgi:hypothetical protein